MIANRHFYSWRASMLFAAVLAGVVLTGITEGLSRIQALSFYPLVICWLMVTIFSAAGAVAAWSDTAVQVHGNGKNLTLSDKVFLGIILFIGTVSAITAITGIPNTWDSMTYHLPRVAHWIQNSTVGFYPTNDARQLYITPWAEFAVTHARILSSWESSANLIQWAAMAGSLIGVSLIARQLGANRTGQLMTATLAATLPMGILQSVSTQTDYVGAFWLIAFVFFLIEIKRKPFWVYFIACGLSLGLAFLTKGNSYIFAVPFLLWFAGSNLKHAWKVRIKASVLILVLALAVNIGQYSRNMQTFGSPSSGSAALMNASFSGKILVVNLLRNISLHLSMPWIDVNEHTIQLMTKAAQFFGADINDPGATYNDRFALRSLNFDEDYTANSFHGLLFGLVFLLCWFFLPLRQKVGSYALTVACSFLLFCLVVRYQSWNSRFHLPLFVLFCPVAGIVLEHFLKKKSIIIAGLLFLAALPWMFLNQQHPWFGEASIWRQPKMAQYFYKRPNMALPYVASAGYLKSMGCRQVGLLIGGENWEYPWWKFLQGPGLRIEHVLVSNQSGNLKYPLGDFQPCAIIVLGQETKPYFIVGGGIYAPAWGMPAGSDKVTIFLRKP
jgi:hypothetical protein